MDEETAGPEGGIRSTEPVRERGLIIYFVSKAVHVAGDVLLGRGLRRGSWRLL